LRGDATRPGGVEASGDGATAATLPVAALTGGAERRWVGDRMMALAILQSALVFVVLALVELALVLTPPSPVPGWVLALAPIIAIVYAGAGAAAWMRRPSSRMGALLAAAGLAWLLSGLANTAVPALSAVGLVLMTLPLAVVVHLLHGFPSGRLQGRIAVGAVLGGYFACTVMQAPQYLFGQGAEGPATILQIADRPDLAQAGLWSQWAVGSVVMAITAWLLWRRWRTVAPARRAGVAPLLAYGIAAVLFVPISGQLGGAVLPAGDWTLTVAVCQLVVMAGVAIAFAATMLRGGFARTLEVEELLDRLADEPSEREVLARTLAQALGDPSLQLAFWGPARDGYVDAVGLPLALDEPGPDRAILEVELGGRPLGALVFDATLVADRALVEAVARVAALAIERIRLTAELRASHEEVQLSRARIVAAVEEERRKLARDLHDGLQSELVLAAMIADRIGRDPTLPAAARSAVEALDERLRSTIEELRRLVHGVLPTLLVERGLFVAVRELVDRLPVPVELRLEPAPRRLSPAIEGTVYFVVSEGVANLLKHAGAKSARVSVIQLADRLLVELADDGVGGAAVGGGTGLRGAIDRVEALGGTLAIESPPGAGTKLSVELPCGS